MVIVTRVLVEQSGIGVRLLARAHICLRRRTKGLVVRPTQRPVPLTPEKKVPQLQVDFSPEFHAEVKNEFSWVPAVWEGARGAIILPMFLSFSIIIM